MGSRFGLGGVDIGYERVRGVWIFGTASPMLQQKEEKREDNVVVAEFGK